MITNVLNHATAALGRLATQFRDSPRLKGFITVVANEVQLVENAFQDMLAQFRDLDVATDNALDNLGDLIGAPVRGSRDNPTYRLRVKGQVVVNKSSGANADLYTIAKDLVTAWNIANQPRIDDHVAAHATVLPVGALRNLDTQAQELAQVLNGSRTNDGAASAGVRVIVHSRPDTVAEGGFFRFAGGAGSPAGFGVGAFVADYDK